MNQYLIYAWDGTDENALDRRMSTRPAHFEGARALKASGNFVIGGALLNKAGNMAGSVMILQFETEAELDLWMKSEPYIVNKVWQNIEVHPFRVAPI